MGRRKRPRLSDELLFGVCERFLNGEKTRPIADWVNQELGSEQIKRADVYRYVEHGVRRRFLVLRPPAHVALQRRVAERHRGGNTRGLHVVAARGLAAAEAVAARAADLAFEAMSAVARERGEVHVGLGAGSTTALVVQHLVARLRSAAPPRLVLHALSTGFQGYRASVAPVAFFGLFDALDVDVRYFGLFAPSVVHVNDYERLRQQPGVAECFAAAREIDVVISSLASAEDPHGMLNEYLHTRPEADMAALRKAGWIGDVQYRPYSATGPLREPAGLRAVTVIELKDLVAMAGQRSKSVILVAAPCGKCHKSRTAALLPLLHMPRLKLWTDIVMDAQTARELTAA